MTDYGTDFSALVNTAPDEQFTLIEGRRVLAESLARRLTCPPGGLWWAPNEGIDLRALVRARLDKTQLTTLKAQIQAQLSRDERVLSAKATIVHDTAAKKLTVTISVETAEGPFSFVLSVSDAKTEVFGFSA